MKHAYQVYEDVSDSTKLRNINFFTRLSDILSNRLIEACGGSRRRLGSPSKRNSRRQIKSSLKRRKSMMDEVAVCQQSAPGFRNIELCAEPPSRWHQNNEKCN